MNKCIQDECDCESGEDDQCTCDGHVHLNYGMRNSTCRSPAAPAGWPVLSVRLQLRALSPLSRARPCALFPAQ